MFTTKRPACLAGCGLCSTKQIVTRGVHGNGNHWDPVCPMDGIPMEREPKMSRRMGTELIFSQRRFYPITIFSNVSFCASEANMLKTKIEKLKKV